MPPLERSALYRLMTWLSPAYPVGAFSYSCGIEWAVEAGDVHDAGTLRDWLEATLSGGAGWSDAIFFAEAYRAVKCCDDATFVQVAELAAAFAPTRERYLETTSLGRTFVEITQAAWPCAALGKLRELWQGPIAYPVAVGITCAGHAISLDYALRALVTAIVANWTSAGVRLIPLGHTQSQHLLNALEPAVEVTAQRALNATLDDLGNACFRADIASARHKSQYTRLFRS